MKAEFEDPEIVPNAFSHLHDGFLEGITLSKDRTLHLLCRDINDQSWLISMTNLFRLKADNFLQGNIIFRVNLYCGASCPVELVGNMYDHNERQTVELLPKTIEEISRLNWTLFEIQSSYGCELLALCAVIPQSITCKRVFPFWDDLELIRKRV